MNAAGERRLTTPLAVVAVLLGALLLALLAGLGRSVHWDAARPAAAQPQRQAPVRPPAPVPLQHYALVWQKPLFSPDRKPSSQAAGPASNIGDLALTGIILTPDVRIALLENARSHEQIRVREGATLPDGSNRLVELRPRSAIFDAPSGRVELKLPSGAPIDAPRAKAAPASSMAFPPPPDEDPRSRDPNRSHTGLSGEPDDEPDGAPPEAGFSDSDSGNSMLPPPRQMNMPAAGRSATNEGADAQQAERIRRLREAIQKRRAEQAAPATHEGDR